MTHHDLETAVSDWLIDFPHLLSTFETLGIDYCCGGKSLRFACIEQNLSPETVLERLRAKIGEAE